MAWYLFDVPIYLLHLNWFWYCEWCHRVTSPAANLSGEFQDLQQSRMFAAGGVRSRSIDGILLEQQMTGTAEYFWCFGNPLVELKYGVCGYVWHSSISPVPYFCHGFVDSASHDPHSFQLHFEFDCPAHRNLQITSDALDFRLLISHILLHSSFCRVFSTILTVFVVELLMGTSFVLVLGKGWVNQSVFGQVFQPAWMCTQRMPWFPCCAMGSPRPWR